MENLTFWQYIKKHYGVDVSYSNTGWKIKRGVNKFEEGEFATGALKSKMGIPQDLARLNKNKLAAMAVIHNLLAEQFKRDSKLQELYGATRIVARRRANG